jgi:hypothetical protein
VPLIVYSDNGAVPELMAISMKKLQNTAEHQTYFMAKNKDSDI